ncbi:MAG: helix-turn-helix transcriptional regulator [Gallionella sp.]|nr:helix-turn-helix transcriptional regulator [Gallionella sp.]
MQPLNSEKNSFGGRLKEERQRLGHTQDAFGAGAGVTRLTQSKYEKGESSPNVQYLTAIEEMAVDINYLLTGNKRSDVISTDVHGKYADLAADIIMELEVLINAKGVKLPPATKAQLVATIYRNSQVNSPVNTRLISDLLSLAVA